MRAAGFACDRAPPPRPADRRLVARSVNDFYAGTEAVADAFQRGDFVRRLDLRRTAAVGELRRGVGADDGDSFDPGRIQRQQVFIFQQHKRFLGDFGAIFPDAPSCSTALTPRGRRHWLPTDRESNSI